MSAVTPLVPVPDDLGSLAATVAHDCVEPFADEVDRSSSFPHRAVEGLHAAGLLNAPVAVTYGGRGAAMAEVVRAVSAVSRSCASSGMVYAMHLIQVMCLQRHGGTPELEAYLRQVVADGDLLASATTEVGTGGDVSRSGCAVEEVDDDRFHLLKRAPVISYGEYAAGVLATARRTPDSAPGDQVLVVCRAQDTTLTPTSEWDALGFRGTCSRGFVLDASGPSGLVCRDGYGDIAAQTMLPVSHLVWSAVWLGIADGAYDKARRFAQATARRSPGSASPSALRLAELTVTQSRFEALVADAARRWDEGADDREALGSIRNAVALNTLKVSASQLVADVVRQAMGICGMAGYANLSPYSLGRALRDATGAALMVNNDRILDNTSQLLLAFRDG